MSKKIAMLLTVSVLSAAVPAGTVMAEENTPTTVGQMEPGAPQTQGEAPSMNGKQTPQQNPQMGGKPGMNMNQRPGRMGKGHQGGQGSFENLLKDGTITQETYDAIRNYMQENKPEAKTPETQNNAAEQNNEAV